MTANQRRDYGTGTVFFNESKGLWIARAENGVDGDGKRRPLERSGKTKAIALRKLTDLRRQVAKDGGQPKASPTVKSWADDYLKIAERTLAPKAYAATRSNVTKWIVPTIGRRRLDQLSRADLRKVQDAQRSADMKTSSIRRTHAVAIKMLKDAHAEGHTVPSGVLSMPAPAANESTRTSFSLDQTALMLEQIAATDDPSRWLAILFQGLRPAERRGLQRDLVNFDDNVIQVGWQLQELPYIDVRNKELGFRVPDGHVSRHLVGRWHLVPPKTKAGVRWVPMIPWFSAALQAYLAEAPENDYGLVWADADGQPLDSAVDLADWKALQKAAGVEHPTNDAFVLHEGRHTTATLLREVGVAENIIIDIIGHASIRSTQVYIHDDTREKARQAMLALHQRIARETKLELLSIWD